MAPLVAPRPEAPVDNTDGSVYEGDRNTEGQREGHGLERWQTGTEFEGEWAGGRRQGQGIYRHAE